jgi:uncharacterized cupredoxin-like copper-binding protein
VRRWRTAILSAALVAAALAASATASITPADRTVVLDVRHSRFSPSELIVKRGQTVHFVVRNDDPIDHELIVGPRAVHDRHESGREAAHPPVPGEVSVPLLGTASTSYTFAERGTVAFGCHLPGHWAYGMRGRVIVR